MSESRQRVSSFLSRESNQFGAQGTSPACFRPSPAQAVRRCSSTSRACGSSGRSCTRVNPTIYHLYWSVSMCVCIYIYIRVNPLTLLPRLCGAAQAHRERALPAAGAAPGGACGGQQGPGRAALPRGAHRGPRPGVYIYISSFVYIYEEGGGYRYRYR